MTRHDGDDADDLDQGRREPNLDDSSLQFPVLARPRICDEHSVCHQHLEQQEPEKALGVALLELSVLPRIVKR